MTISENVERNMFSHEKHYFLGEKYTKLLTLLSRFIKSERKRKKVIVRYSHFH